MFGEDPIITVFIGCFGGVRGSGFVAKWTKLPSDAPLSCRIALGKGFTRDEAVRDLFSQSPRGDIFSIGPANIINKYEGSIDAVYGI
jgi:hypothetical protein